MGNRAPVQWNFDASAGVQPFPEVVESMVASLRRRSGNPASFHHRAKSLRQEISRTREKLVNWLTGGRGHWECVFTSGGAEAACMAVRGGAHASRRFGNHLIMSTVEHPVVLEQGRILEQEGFEVSLIGADREGFVDMDGIRDSLKDSTVMVVVQAANQDVGTVQRIEALSEVLGERGVLLLLDGTFACGWLDPEPLLRIADGIFLSFHRFFGPVGLGALVFRRGLAIESLIPGGAQESGLRAGLENYHALAGLDAWLSVVSDGARRSELVEKARLNQMAALRKLRSRLPGLYLNGPEPGDNRLANGLNISLAGIEGESVVLRSDLKGLLLGSGSACLGSRAETGLVLKAMKATQDRILGSVSLSPGPFIDPDELDAALEVFIESVEFLRALDPQWEEKMMDREAMDFAMGFEIP